MKKLLVFLCAMLLVFAITPSLGQATLIPASSASGTGFYNNSPNLLIDGIIPGQGTLWNLNTNVWWNGTGPIFTIDLGGLYYVEDIILSVDNNDSYDVDYSVNNSDWSSLFSLSSAYGEVNWGMDTMGTIAGDSEYVWQINFSVPVEAQYLRIYAIGGDNSYAVGELQSYGEPVPEPATMLLLGFGLIGLAGIGRKKFLKK